jgi:hypothetical protein
MKEGGLHFDEDNLDSNTLHKIDELSEMDKFTLQCFVKKTSHIHKLMTNKVSTQENKVDNKKNNELVFYKNEISDYINQLLIEYGHVLGKKNNDISELCNNSVLPLSIHTCYLKLCNEIIRTIKEKQTDLFFSGEFEIDSIKEVKVEEELFHLSSSSDDEDKDGEDEDREDKYTLFGNINNEEPDYSMNQDSTTKLEILKMIGSKYYNNDKTNDISM